MQTDSADDVLGFFGDVDGYAEGVADVFSEGGVGECECDFGGFLGWFGEVQFEEGF